jgi:hypothetical protein
MGWDSGEGSWGKLGGKVMSDLNEVLARVRKLLALAGNNPNENERNAALGKAQALMMEHKVEMAQVASSPETTDEPVTDDHEPVWGTQRGRRAPWRGLLLVALAVPNACKVLWYGGEMRLIGSKSNVEYVRALYQWVAPQVDRMATERGRGQGRVYIDNMRRGIIDGIRDRLKEQPKESSVTALVIVDREKAALTAFLKTIDTGRPVQSNARGDQQARSAGRAAAGQISLSPAGRQVASGTLRLKPGK